MVHFILGGETGGSFTVSIKNKKAEVSDGLNGTPTCVIRAEAQDYEDLELGKVNPQVLFMGGRIKVTDLTEAMKFIACFKRLK